MKGPNSRTDERSFSDHVARPAPTLVREIWTLLRHNKKWWLTPVIAVLLLLGMLVLIGGTAAAPFIYTLF